MICMDINPFSKNTNHKLLLIMNFKLSCKYFIPKTSITNRSKNLEKYIQEKLRSQKLFISILYVFNLLVPKLKIVEVNKTISKVLIRAKYLLFVNKVCKKRKKISKLFRYLAKMLYF